MDYWGRGGGGVGGGKGYVGSPLQNYLGGGGGKDALRHPSSSYAYKIEAKIIEFLSLKVYPFTLTLETPSKNCSRRHFIFYFYLSKEIRLDVSLESSARQRIHKKFQVLFSLKNNENVSINVVCCSRDWRFKG